MISDETIAEVRALEEARRAQYIAEQKRAATRSELDAILREHINYRDHDHRQAVEAVIDKGWRPPARLVEGTGDFDALRSGAILRVTNGTTTSVWRKVGRQWESTEIGTGELCDSIDLDDFCRDEQAEATVIFEPEVGR